MMMMMMNMGYVFVGCMNMGYVFVGCMNMRYVSDTAMARNSQPVPSQVRADSTWPQTVKQVI